MNNATEPGAGGGVLHSAQAARPCVVDCYLDYFRQFIRNNELQNLFIFDPLAGDEHSA